jgi:hypothetical protein
VTDAAPWLEDSALWDYIQSSELPIPPQPILELQYQELIAAFRDLQQLSRILNAGATNKRRISGTAFQDRICSVQYRLLRLQDALEGTLSECVRLAMLAFLATMFQEPENRVRYPYLTRQFRKSCRAVQTSSPQLRDLMLWMLIIGAISLFDVDEPWLREHWKATVPPDTDWADARQRLKGILWIDAVHDRLGWQAFKDLNLEKVEWTGSDSSTVPLWTGGWTGCFYGKY